METHKLIVILPITLDSHRSAGKQFPDSDKLNTTLSRLKNILFIYGDRHVGISS